MRKLAEQMAEQRQNMKVTKKKGEGVKKVETNADELGKKTRSELMAEQRMLILDERAEFEERLGKMAQRHDHLERARRQEEREVLALKWDAQQKEDLKLHEENLVVLKKQHKESRAHDVAEKARFGKMTPAVNAFRERVMAKRKVEHEVVLAQWREDAERQRLELEAERAEVARIKAEREAELEKLRLEAEEEEARRIQAEAEAKRKKEEAEEERKRVEERQRKKEQELEEKQRQEKADALTARLAEREKKGRSWAAEDDEMDFEKESAFKKEAEAAAKEERPKNEERWEGHNLGGERAAPADSRSGGDRWESRDGPRRGGFDRDGPPRGGGFDRDGPRGKGDGPPRGGFDRDGPPRGGFDRDGPPRGGGDGDDRWNRDPRSGPRDDGPPRGKGDGPPRGKGDGPPRGGFDRGRDRPREGGGGDSGGWRR